MGRSLSPAPTLWRFNGVCVRSRGNLGPPPVRAGLTPFKTGLSGKGTRPSDRPGVSVGKREERLGPAAPGGSDGVSAGARDREHSAFMAIG